jgi:heme/copper-type cytochrome/quinol oxidase subunit 2
MMKSLTALLTAFALTGIQSVFACEGCRVPNPSEPATIQAGIGLSWSVLFMLVVVAVILSGMTWFITKTCRQVDRQNQSRGNKA